MIFLSYCKNVVLQKLNKSFFLFIAIFNSFDKRSTQTQHFSAVII